MLFTFNRALAWLTRVTEKVWKVALGTGANVLALNIIEAAAASSSLTKRRNSLNAMIAGHQEERMYVIDHLRTHSFRISLNGFSYTCDLWKAIQYNTLDAETREKLWDDGLHLTGEGYKLMGDVIAARLFEILQITDQPKNVGQVAASE